MAVWPRQHPLLLTEPSFTSEQLPLPHLHGLQDINTQGASSSHHPGLSTYPCVAGHIVSAFLTPRIKCPWHGLLGTMAPFVLLSYA